MVASVSWLFYDLTNLQGGCELAYPRVVQLPFCLNNHDRQCTENPPHEAVIWEQRFKFQLVNPFQQLKCLSEICCISDLHLFQFF